MILIRGINGESYACKIEKGIVDCRDLLSALLKPPVTGYEYSDYYEKNMVKTLAHFSKNRSNLQDWEFLYSLSNFHREASTASVATLAKFDFIECWRVPNLRLDSNL